MYRAIIKVVKFSRSGWDEYYDTDYIYVKADTKEDVVKLADCKVKSINNEDDSKGDFGITLSSRSARVVGYEKVEEVYI